VSFVGQVGVRVVGVGCVGVVLLLWWWMEEEEEEGEEEGEVLYQKKRGRQIDLHQDDIFSQHAIINPL
jgi:hypothetical protein